MFVSPNETATGYIRAHAVIARVQPFITLFEYFPSLTRLRESERELVSSPKAKGPRPGQFNILPSVTFMLPPDIYERHRHFQLS